MDNNLFRLAAVLYADNNYEVSSKTTLKKIVEAAILDNGNKSTSIHTIISLIDQNYHLQLDESEINAIVKANPDSFISKENKGELFVYLSEKRKLNLDKKLSGKTIDVFITEFVQSYDGGFELNAAKELIYKFLYDVLNSNIEGYKKLVDSKGEIDESFDLEYHDYSPKEKDLINDFLKWDNNDKNIAVFNIASYALEYCLICNNGAGVHIKLTNLKNKVFYIDTNVIFRILGLNGVKRMQRSKQFLRKFQELNIQVVISKFIEQEFKNTVKFYVDKLRKTPLYSNLNPKIFEQRYFDRMDDFNDFYYKWRAGKVNDSLELFESHILSLYEAFKNEYKVEADYAIPIDEKDEELDKKIANLAQEIGSHKSKENISHGAIGDRTDALNVLLIEHKRNGKFSNVFETKYFFLSTDQSLRRWDYHRNSHTPVVILPSQWMSILLRYVNRTNDDYKSFVSFLNLPNQESMVSSDRLHIVLSGITEMTTNFEQQYNLVQSLVQSKFEGILENDLDDEQILKNVKDFVSSELSQKVEELKGTNEEIQGQLDSHILDSTQKIDDLNKKISNQSNTINHHSNRNDTLTETFVQHKVRVWRQWAYFFFLPLFILCVAFFVLAVFFQTSDKNPVAIAFKLIDGDVNETRRNFFATLFYVVPAGLISTSAAMCYKRLLSIDTKIEKVEKIRRSNNLI